MNPVSKLPSQITLGPVALTVSDLPRSLDFYRRAVGLRLIGEDDRVAVLGVGQRPLLELTAVPGAGRVPWRTGLYHFALLLPSRHDLGQALRNLIATNTRMTGGADHLVSEALYLDDPDGNGIEIYRDRPRSEWPILDGRPQMDTLALDYDAILAEGDGALPAPYRLHPDSIMGHVHLHVADLQAAIRFYRDVVGFNLQMLFGAQAAFLATGGYHHHIGINTWAGVGAPPPPEGATGLRHFTVFLPSRQAEHALIGRLQEAHHHYESGEAGLLTHDPSSNKIVFVAQ
jgi:catechol 2,3-dioxygenase